MMINYRKIDLLKHVRLRFWVFGFLMFAGSINGQESTSKKELKEEHKQAEAHKTQALIDSKVFTFEARTAITNKGRSINLNGNPNFVKFSPEMIESSMPFFGRVTGTVGYGSDAGYDFSGKPEKYEITANKKKHKLDAEVRGSHDTFRIYLDISDSGSATLSISSNNRTNMTYYGHIYKTKIKE